MAGINMKARATVLAAGTAAVLTATGGLWLDLHSILASDAFKIIPHSAPGILGLVFNILMCFTGAAAGLLWVWFPEWIRNFSIRLERRRYWPQWVEMIILTAIPAVWIFTPWKDIHPGFWFSLFYYGGCAAVLSVLTAREKDFDFFRWLITAGLLVVYSQSVQEIWNIPTSGIKWRAVFWVYYPAAMVLTTVFIGLAHKRETFSSWMNRLSVLAKKAGMIRWAVALIIFLIFPWLCLYSPWGDFFNGSYFRLAILGINTLLITCLVGDDQDWKSYFLILGIQAYTFALAGSLTSVTNYPFALGWSEGNRFYDYSSVFGKYLYQLTGPFSVPYFSPGRYGLWGIWFLIPGLPIWFHRLWDVVLWMALPLIAGWLLARHIRIDRKLVLGMTFWAALFLNQGPVYPPLVISAIIVLVFTTRSLWLRAATTAIAGYYAGISRFTWALSAGIWAALIELIDNYPARKGSWLKRLLPALLLAALGILPGVLSSWAPVLTNSQTGFLTKQPLLWYRLLPNTTYAPGIAFGLLLAAGPTVVVLGWMLITRRWKMDTWQVIAVAGSLIGFLGIGLTASVKIGGGSNLHNLDMFFVTLVILAAMGVGLLVRQPSQGMFHLPGWIKALMVLAVLFPAWNSVIGYTPLHLPDEQTVQRDIQTIQKNVDEAKSKGEVLFLDQRQLLTFGTIKNVPLVMDYEKKYMMDQAMGGNTVYFEQFEKDLAGHRFTLIISEPLKINYSEGDHNFNEENDAWVKYVSEMILKYYQPIATLKEYTGVELLVPIQ